MPGGSSGGSAAAALAKAAQQAQQRAQRAQVLRLPREVYTDVLAPARTRWAAQLVDFLATLPPFAHWSKNRLRRLAMVTTVEQALPGDEVVQQGVLAQQAIFVFSG